MAKPTNAGNQRSAQKPNTTVVTEETAASFQKFRADLKAMLPIVARLLPSHITSQAFEAIVISAIQGNPELLKCEPRSLLNSCRELAELGLSLSKQRREADILPRWSSKLNCKEAQLQIRFGGLMTLAKRSGEVKAISSTAVRQGDKFLYERGLNPILEHKPVLNNTGALMAAYCVWTLKDGTKEFEVVELEDIARAKKASQSRNRDGELVGPWIEDEEEQWRKTAIRRASKYMPSSAEDFQRAVAMDTLRDVGHEVELRDGEVIDITEAEERKPTDRPAAAQNQLNALESKISMGTGIPQEGAGKPKETVPRQQAENQQTAGQQRQAAPPAKPEAPQEEIVILRVSVPKDPDGQSDYAEWVKTCLQAIPKDASPAWKSAWRETHELAIEGADMAAPDIIEPLLKALAS